jgi:hypothetical protein
MAMTESVQLRHAPTADCDGEPIYRWRSLAAGGRVLRPWGECGECGAFLCSCELAYGHDCEG